MFSHSFEVDKIIVGFRSRIKTFSDNKESTVSGSCRDPLYGMLRSVTALKSSVTFVL